MKKHTILLILILLITLSGCSSSVEPGYTDRYSRQDLLKHKTNTDSSVKKLDDLRKMATSKTKESPTDNSSPGDIDVTEKPEEAKSDTTVFITKTGTKYHTSSCPYLKKSKTEITIEEAKMQNLSPCSTCNPDS